MFIDEVTIKARAGDGGRGCASFRREKYEPWGGPNGGDGGKGGDVVLRGDDDQNNLIDFKFKPHWTGERGEHGLGKDCNGREGKPAVLRVPLGTVAYNFQTTFPSMVRFGFHRGAGSVGTVMSVSAQNTPADQRASNRSISRKHSSSNAMNGGST